MPLIDWSVVAFEQPSASKWNQLGDNDNFLDAKIDSEQAADDALFTSRAAGWVLGTETAGIGAPNTITANGNRSYQVVFNSVDHSDILSAGMRLRLTRTTAAPTQCTDLEASSSQYYNKTSPNKLTFTDDFVCSAWIKLESYPSGNYDIISRYNGTSGWRFTITSAGQVLLVGYNAGAANYSQVYSYQSLPLGKWVHVAAQLDMSAFTATTTTSYVMFDGVDVPSTVGRGGTNPTALVQAGNLELGSTNGGTSPFDGKLAQVAVYSAKVTQATILASIDRTLSGSETSLASAYSFNNSIADLNTTTPNDLTAQNSAVATNADSPFAGGSGGTIEYGIITKVAFSTNTTLTVQVPEGYALPTSGSISAAAYSTQKEPYGFPAQNEKWAILSLYFGSSHTQSSPVANTWYNPTPISGVSGGTYLTVPVGAWVIGYEAALNVARAAAGAVAIQATLSTGSSTESDYELGVFGYAENTTSLVVPAMRYKALSVSTQAPYYLNIRTIIASQTAITLNSTQAFVIKSTLAYL